MKSLFRVACALLALLGWWGCDELIVKDISRQEVRIVTPSSDAVLSDGKIVFSWEILEHADYYRLILFSTADGNNGQLLADTLLDGNRLTLEEPLVAGSYRWRLQAFNSEYQTPLTTHSFRVQIAPDISAEMLLLLSPSDGLELETGVVTFSWEPLAGAEQYRLWVASPSFAGAQQMLADETLTETLYQLELPDGPYQWRLQAFNDEFHTERQTASFRVRSVPDISGETVTVLAPQPEGKLTSADVLFSWEAVPGAEQYRIRIATPDFGPSGQLVEDTDLTETTFRMTLPDGPYEWRIQAVNSTSETEVRTRSFRVETIPDISREKLTIVTPTANAVVKQREVVFAWNALAGAEEYRLRIVSPSFALAEWAAADVLTPETIYRSELPDGEYQWQIQAMNSASQTAPQVYSFQVQTSDIKDISRQRIDVIAPADGVQTTNQNILFAWEPVDGATQYRLMIVSPSFGQAELLLEDATVEQTSFRATLPIGDYQWRIRAINDGYRTEWQTYELEIMP